MFFASADGNWRHNVTNSALIGANFLVLFLGIKLQTRTGWYLGFGLIGLVSFWAWYANLKRYRTVADTPTSRIASAPQGYVEIIGRGQHPAGNRQLISRFTGLPCLWYRYVIERKDDDQWEHVESGESNDSFVLNDGSGQLLIDPDGAEILISNKQIINREGYRIIEWTLIEGETIYVIGEHVSLGGPHSKFDKRADTSVLLSEWKRDKARLLARFDANRDGEISLDEWENVRHAAATEVDRTHFNIRLEDSIHLIRKPAHGRPFLIANREVTSLVRHFRIWSWTHLAMLAAALSGLTWLGRLP
ncbi:MAG: hypothetical protein IV085_10005 [Thiobacillus sp.]|nr:hypothetical protein [Thiobacillus sp.]